MLGRIAGYELLELLGEGGMGVVFRARDPRLNKIVAIKILPDELALNPEYRARFFREARAEASLSHPTIATCFAIDEAELDPPDLIPSKTLRPPLASKLYLTMEFVPGSDLSEIAKGEPIEIPRVLDLASQIAAGLEAAHSAGVVHRDLKPANVRVTPDSRVKILDFGLASTIPTPDGPTQDFDTSRDHVMGTCHFMAPEQTRGRTTDPRSDLFSLGVILYLLVTGRLPFNGTSYQEVVNAITHAEPPPMARYANSVPDELERILHKLLAKDVENRYQSAHEVRTDLEQLRSAPPPKPAPPKPRYRRALLVALGAVLVLVAGWWASVVYRPWRALAVVPFANHTGDLQLNYVGDGVAAGVRGLLIRISRLSVAAASTVQQIPPEQQTAKHLAHELGVNGILTGSFSKRNEILHLDLELVEGRHGFLIWAEGYDYDLAAGDDVERRIASDVAVRLSRPGDRLEPAPRSARPRVSTAYALVLHAIAALDDPDDKNSPEHALSSLDQALDQDPDYARAWAWRSRALWKLWDRDRAEESLQLCEEAANRAVRLNPELLDARLARAQVYRAMGRYTDSIRELTSLLRFNPNWDEAELHLAAAYRDAGDLAQAEAHNRRATEVHPESWRNWNSLGYVLDLRADYAGARAAYREVIRLVPKKNVGYTQLATVEIKTGQYEAAIALYEQLPSPGISDAVTATNMGIAYFFTHRLEKAGRYFTLATRLEPRTHNMWVNLGDLDVRAGRPDSASVCYTTALQLLDEQLHVNPKNIQLHMQRVLCLAKLSRCSEVPTALAAVPDSLLARNADFMHELAKAYALCGRRAQALAAARRAAALGVLPRVLRDEDEFAAIVGDPAFPTAAKTP